MLQYGGVPYTTLRKQIDVFIIIWFLITKLSFSPTVQSKSTIQSLLDGRYTFLDTPRNVIFHSVKFDYK